MARAHDGHDGQAAIRNVVHAAHNSHLEIHAIFKPFETGNVGARVPHPLPVPPGMRTGKDLTGPNIDIAPFVHDHPHLRMRRTTGDYKNEGPIKAIRLWSANNETSHTGASDVEIWTGRINGKFQRYMKGFKFAQSSESRNGVQVSVLTFSDLDIDESEHYVLVRFMGPEGKGTFQNQTQQMIEFIGPEGRPLPCTGDQGIYTRAKAEELQHRGRRRWNGKPFLP